MSFGVPVRNSVAIGVGGAVGFPWNEGIPSLELDFANNASLDSRITFARNSNGHIKSIRYYPSRLPNVTLQELTS